VQVQVFELLVLKHHQFVSIYVQTSILVLSLQVFNVPDEILVLNDGISLEDVCYEAGLRSSP
jgi:hypothetical protein